MKGFTSRTIVRRISNSEIQSWKRCRRQWWLAWHRGLRLKSVSPLGALAIGGRIHEALATYYVPEGQTRTDPRETLEFLIELDWAIAGLSALFTAEDRKKFQSEADLQRIMLEGYMEWLAETGADQDFEVIAPEAYVEAELSPSLSDTWDMLILIIGRLDVLLRNHYTNLRLFLDHKTTADINGSIKNLRMNPQMRTYRLLVDLTNPDGRPSMGAVYSMLRKVKRTVRATPPFYHRELLTFNPHELESFKKQLLTVVNEILGTEESLNRDHPIEHHFLVPPTVGDHCNRCVFQRECPMFDDGSRVEDALTNRFTVGEPLHYYGKEDLQRHDRTDAGPVPTGRCTVTSHPLRIEARKDDAGVDGTVTDLGTRR